MMRLKKNTIWVSIFFIFLTIMFIFPLIPHFGKSIPYTHAPVPGFEKVKNFQGDHYQYLYHLALLEKALSGHIPFWDIGYQFDTPYKPKLSTKYFPPQGLLFYLFSFLGYAAAYNILITLSLLVSLFSTYFYLKEIKLTTLSATAGAVIYSFFPYRMAALFGGHPAGMMVAYIPLFLFFLEKGIGTRNRTLLFGAGITLSIFSVSEPHYFYFLNLMLPIYLLYIFIRETISDVKLPNLITSFFKKANLTEKYYFLSGLSACLTFFIFYSYRRGNTHLISILLFATIGTLFFFTLLLAIHLFYKKIKPSVSVAKKRSIISKQLLLLNILYIYFIQLFTEIKGLAILLIGSIFFLYAILLCISPTKSEWHLFVKKTTKRLRSHTTKTIAFLKFCYPFLIILLLGIISVLAMKHGNIKGSSIAKGRTLFEVGLFSPNVKDLFSPFNSNSATYVYPGSIAILIIVFYIIYTIGQVIKPRCLKKRDITILFFTGIFIFSFLLAFGPNINTPPLFILCRKIIPFFHFIRSPIKIIILTALALAVLTAMALQQLKNKKTLIYILIVLLTGEYYLINKCGITSLQTNNKVLTAIKTASPKAKIAYIPIWPGDTSWSSLYQLYSLVTDTYMINGYQPTLPAKYITEIFHPLYGLNFGQVTYQEWKKLTELGVTHLVFHKEAFPRKVSPFPQNFTRINLDKNKFLEFVLKDDPLYLYKLKDIPKKEALTLQKTTKTPFPFGFTVEGQWFKPVQGESSIYKNATYSSNGGIQLTSNEATVSYKKYLPADNYNGFVSFDLKTTDITTLSITLIDPNGNENQIATQRSYPSDQRLSFPFTFSLDQPGRVTLKINKRGIGTVFIDYLHLTISEQPDSPFIISPDTGIFIGRVIKENNENVIFIDAKDYPAGPAFFGPNRLYKKGTYKLIFNLKSIPSLKNNFVELKVTDSYGSKTFAKRILSPEELGTNWQEFVLPFSIMQDEILNFHVHFPGYGKLWVGKIILTKK